MTENDDNQENNTYPFKGPFKGKGQNLNSVKELSKQLIQIKRDMESLVQRYDDMFASPRIANLRILKRQIHPLVYWRQSKRSGSYFSLFDSDAGSDILERTGATTKVVLLRFEDERLMLNARSSIVGAAHLAYSNYLKRFKAMENYAHSLNIKKQETLSGSSIYS